MWLEREKEHHGKCSFLTIARVLRVGGPSPTAPAPIGARSVQGGRVGALIGQVAPLAVACCATAWSGATRGSAVAHADLTELLVDLETLLTQLLHFLLNRNREGRKWSWGLGFIAHIQRMNTHKSLPVHEHVTH